MEKRTRLLMFMYLLVIIMFPVITMFNENYRLSVGSLFISGLLFWKDKGLAEVKLVDGSFKFYMVSITSGMLLATASNISRGYSDSLFSIWMVYFSVSGFIFSAKVQKHIDS
jgi:hypothetical protein